MNFIFLILVLFKLSFAKDWSHDQSPLKWNNQAKESIEKILFRKLNKNVAKNLILFLGDGMGIPTVTAGRIRRGQMQGLLNNIEIKLCVINLVRSFFFIIGKSGEEFVTAMESLDNLALSKVKFNFKCAIKFLIFIK